MTEATQLQCACGRLRLDVQGAPIVSVECCCNSCRAAAARLRPDPGAASITDAKGATRFVLYRKDRIRFVQGVDQLAEFRLTPEAKTRRVLATCCGAPVFLEFENGHWLSLYGALFPADQLPALEMRTMTIDLPAGTALPEDVANGKRQPLSFMIKLLGAWIAMRFRSPKIDIGSGVIHA
jgi:hypothetical protein